MSNQGHARVPVQQNTLNASSFKDNLLQRTCSCGQHTIAGAECSSCRGEQSMLLRPGKAARVSSNSIPIQEKAPSEFTGSGEVSHFGYDFSQVRIHTDEAVTKPNRAVSAFAWTGRPGVAPGMGQHRAETIREKSVEGGEQNFIDDLLEEHAPAENDAGDAGPADAGVADAGPADAGPADAGAAPAGPTDAGPGAPAGAKPLQAGVDSFTVKWSKHAGGGAADAKLRLDFTAKFKKDADHDPSLAEFRQSVMSTWNITAGPHKGRKGTSAPMHDDNYSRADDLSGNKKTDVDFYSNDNPGYNDLNKDDVLDYSFTAEQTIIDTSQANKVIAKRGPHTATVKGKHPRDYKGIPKTLS